MINYTEKGRGLHREIYDAGYVLEQLDNVHITYFADDRSKTQSEASDVAVNFIISNFDPLPVERRRAKVRIVAEINEHFAELENSYPEIEKKRFIVQEWEYDRWIVDDSSPTPTIDAIANRSGRDRLLQIQSVGEKLAAYREPITNAIGDRQKLFDQIEAELDWQALSQVKYEAT